MEDIDFTRCKAEYVDAIYEDLTWLGLSWPEPVLFQSTRQSAYDAALEQLKGMGVIYGCQCTRKDLALSAPHGSSPIYPGTCRNLNLQSGDLNWRLDAKRATKLVGTLRYHEIGQNRDLWMDAHVLDDVVLARKDIGTSYHLAVVVDDAFQNITHVTRGADLEEQTPIHVLLQALLGYPTPIYRHHRLILDENGKRLAKRDPSRELRHYRELGFTRDEVKKLTEIDNR